MSDLDHFYLKQAEPNRGCFLALRSIVLSFHEKMNETRKYGMPCFCFGKKMFCYLWTDKKTNEPYLLMVDGKHLTHPKLEAGNRSRMKILPINPKEDLPIDTINSVLEEALNLYKNGTLKIN